MRFLPILSLLVLGTAAALADDPKESDYYKITTFEMPQGSPIEVSAMEFLPGGKIALGTRRGEIWIASNAGDKGASNVTYQLFASGQHEILGLAYKDGLIYATNRYEVLRLKDVDGDGRADIFETVNDKWGVSGDYHEYAWSSPFDKNGDLWVLLCLTGSFTSEAEFRGWAMRVKPDGTLVPTCSGIRSPGGIGFDATGNVYYTDNQGPWRGATLLNILIPGSFQGHPGGNKWYDLAPNMGPRPADPVSGSRLETERAKIKQFVPPVVYMVHGKIGNSSSFVAADVSGGKFGPFEKQMFVGDQSFSNVARVYVEEVNGVHQGVVFPFLGGFKCGLIPGKMMASSGQLFVGGAARGWGSTGPDPVTFERVDWTGKVPFEVHEVHAKPDGFELTFTQPVDPKTAADPASYKVREFNYIYQAEYGSPEVDELFPNISGVTVAPDNKSVRLKVGPLTKGDIHELHFDGVRSAQGLPLLHKVAYYTLNEIPAR